MEESKGERSAISCVGGSEDLEIRWRWRGEKWFGGGGDEY